MEERYKIFTGLILNISRCIQKIKNAEMAALGLKGKQVQCLFSLYNLSDGASLTELCDVCYEDKGAMSRTIKELIEKQLVFVDEKNTQKYRNPIKLTEKGKEYAKQVSNKISNMLEAGSFGITEMERNNLYKTLALISDNLNKICENYGDKND
ncbi:MAG: MarR family winged helix-turn-helix transcriptional regulator [Christensenellales bacterium]